LHDNGWLYVMADETHGTDLKLFDVSDPTDIQFIDTIGTDRGPGSITHNPCFQGDLLHVAWYEDGYWLWSVADPANAQLIGYYDMHPEPYSFSYKGAWGVYPYLPSGQVLISEMQHGLFVLDISQAVGLSAKPATASGLHSWPNPTASMAYVTVPPEFHGKVHITMRDAQGRVIRDRSAYVSGSALAIDLRSVEDGNYFVELINADHRAVVRVIKTNEE
jgi:hypothetical protein